MNDSVKILLLEDDFNDAELEYIHIQKSGFAFEWKHVTELSQFSEEIELYKPDIILSDYNLVGFTGIDALTISKTKCPEIPFIIVTGTLNEETAAETIKSGAWDYVVKDRIGRLMQAIQNALHLKKEKDAKNDALLKLKKSEERFALAVEGTMDGIWDYNFETNESYCSLRFKTMLGFKENELKSYKSWIRLVHPDDRKSTIELLRKHLTTDMPQFRAEFRMKCQNGDYKWILCRGKAVFNENGQACRFSGAIKDITDSKERELELLKFKSAVQGAPVSIMITDNNGNIEYVNPKCIEVSGYNANEFAGKKPGMLKSGNHDAEFYKSLWDNILQGNEWFGEFLNKKKNGELYWESASISGIKNSQGELVSFIAIKEDVTKKKQMEFDLIRAKEKAEESNRLKTAFIRNLSHEIRTPMNGINGFSNMLNKPNLSEESRIKYIQIINNSTERLLKTINNILDISKIESNQLELKLEKIQIKNIIEKMQEECTKNKLYGSKPEVEIQWHFPDEVVDLYLNTDPGRLIQILDNLIINSFNFTDLGTIQIGCNLIHSNSYKEVEFFVKDTGIGIPESDKPIIFETMRQANDNRFKEGMGLGLSISKALVELLNGRIWFESEEGFGTNFHFSIPLE